MLSRLAFSVMLLVLTGCYTVLSPPKPRPPRPANYPPAPYELVHSIPVGSTDILLQTDHTNLNEIRDLLESYRLTVCRLDEDAGTIVASGRMESTRFYLMMRVQPGEIRSVLLQVSGYSRGGGNVAMPDRWSVMMRDHNPESKNSVIVSEVAWILMLHPHSTVAFEASDFREEITTHPCTD